MEKSTRLILVWQWKFSPKNWEKFLETRERASWAFRDNWAAEAQENGRDKNFFWGTTSTGNALAINGDTFPLVFIPALIIYIYFIYSQHPLPYLLPVRECISWNTRTFALHFQVHSLIELNWSGDKKQIFPLVHSLFIVFYEPLSESFFKIIFKMGCTIFYKLIQCCNSKELHFLRFIFYITCNF